ncbi:MAG: class I SAM-dependent methyltransferase [Gammaproteobacteria bacterium]
MGETQTQIPLITATRTHSERNETASICPSCNRGEMATFHRIASVPVNSCVLFDSRGEARDFLRGSIALGFCAECGFVSNTAFDPTHTEYSQRYEETQGFSPTFKVFHEDLARRLIERHDLHQKEIIEIGCGKGEFLILLCELGANKGVGFDPSYIEGRNYSEAKASIRFIQDFYSERYSSFAGDFVCCKMTLEHIHATDKFLQMTRRSMGDRMDTVVFFMVPDATRILRECAFEDIYYEHCSYFSPGSVARLFRKAGFEILNLSNEYDGQYLTIEAKPGDGVKQPPLAAENDLSILAHYVACFQAKYEEKRQFWNRRLHDLRTNKAKVMLWGSGSKAVSFLTSTEASSTVDYVIDVNPHRQGHYMPGTGQEIVAPEFLRHYQPDAVIVMNRIYCDEIQGSLQAVGANPEMVAL